MKKPKPLSLEDLDGVAGGTGQVIFSLRSQGPTFDTGGNDTVYGSAHSDAIYVGEGNDVVMAGDGHDTISWMPGQGHDVFDGGNGADQIAIWMPGLTAEGLIAAMQLDEGSAQPRFNPDTGTIDLTGVSGTLTLNGSTLTFRNMESLWFPQEEVY